MLQAIRDASHAVAMQSYIFDNDPIGREMAQALIEAHGRGVQVRVLIDAIGSRYSRPPIVRMLARGGVPVARFMTNPLGVLRMPYANLRSHRKILVVDGRVGFTGGMNVRAAFVTALSGADTNADTHFRLEGPIVTQLMSVFAHDWNFTTHESLPQRPGSILTPRPPVRFRCAACPRAQTARWAARTTCCWARWRWPSATCASSRPTSCRTRP